jgi:hypothetical protein
MLQGLGGFFSFPEFAVDFSVDLEVELDEEDVGEEDVVGVEDEEEEVEVEE